MYFLHPLPAHTDGKVKALRSCRNLCLQCRSVQHYCQIIKPPSNRSPSWDRC